MLRYEWYARWNESEETHIYFHTFARVCEKHKNDVFMDDYKFMSYLLWYSFIPLPAYSLMGCGKMRHNIFTAIFNSQIDIYISLILHHRWL